MENLIRKIFNKPKNNNDNQDSNSKNSKKYYSNRELVKLIRNKAVRMSVGDSCISVFMNTKHYGLKNRTQCSVDAFLERLGLLEFNYKGYLIKHRHDFLKEVLVKSLHSKYKCEIFTINPKLKNKEIKFIKDGNHIKVEKNDLKQIYINKSEKEKVLKKQYDHLKTEIEQIFNEFNLDIKDKDNVGIDVYPQVWCDIKPNIITHLEFSGITSIMLRMYSSFRGLYVGYLITKLDLIKKEYEGEMYGRLGEEKTIETTNEFDNCIALHNIKLPAKNYSGEIYNFEIDTVLVTTRGIFILEVKNYGAVGDYELKIDSTGRWSTYYPNTNNEVTRQNPNKQNNMHVINFNKFINQNLPQFNNNIDALGIIVIGNDDIKITQENPAKNLKRVDELYNYIKQFPNNIYSMEQVNEIAKCIKENNIETENRYPIDCIYDEVLNNIDFIREELKLIPREYYNYTPWSREFEETFTSYLSEQENNYNYKFIRPKFIEFSRGNEINSIYISFRHY